jgi:hypothetical protein
VCTDGEGDSIRRQDSEPVVIGGQMAAARAAEARHQAEPHGPSPLAGVAYEPAAGELSLLHFARTPKDELIDGFVDCLGRTTGRQWVSEMNDIAIGR